ncbi:MAG: hypothetical protein IT347_13845 [Candidatus Eisenbacteria bacterium]|nr:hypothetical protein [Candidatus Eisenbacteria bacterium]
MRATPDPRSFRVARPLLALAAAVLLAVSGAGQASAQLLKPWVPPGDSLMRDVTTARMRFMRQQGDSVGGDNYLPYDDVGRLARKFLRSIGRQNFLQARAIEATLDSLGFDTEVSVDPKLPGVVLLLVRNPFRISSDGVGFLFWNVGDELRMQGASFPPARDVQLRTWFTSRPASPYEACVIFTTRGSPPRASLKLFRMGADGRFWSLVQYEGNAPDFGDRAQLSFVDANLDGRPEIVSYHPVVDDTFFVIRSGAPPIVNEFLYTERPEGFVLHDARTVPGPVETLRLFAMHLASPEPERAKFFLRDPDRYPEALANGWTRLRGRDAWTVEYGEADEAWPEWLEVRTASPGGAKRWIFRFYIEDGRWVVRDWKPVVENPAPGASRGAPPSAAPAGPRHGAPADTSRAGRR